MTMQKKLIMGKSKVYYLRIHFLDFVKHFKETQKNLIFHLRLKMAVLRELFYTTMAVINKMNNNSFYL